MRFRWRTEISIESGVGVGDDPQCQRSDCPGDLLRGEAGEYLLQIIQGNGAAGNGQTLFPSCGDPSCGVAVKGDTLPSDHNPGCGGEVRHRFRCELREFYRVSGRSDRRQCAIRLLSHGGQVPSVARASAAERFQQRPLAW